MQATIVSDGTLPLGEPSGSFLGAAKDEVGKMLTDNFLSLSQRSSWSRTCSVSEHG